MASSTQTLESEVDELRILCNKIKSFKFEIVYHYFNHLNKIKRYSSFSHLHRFNIENIKVSSSSYKTKHKIEFNAEFIFKIWN